MFKKHPLSAHIASISAAAMMQPIMSQAFELEEVVVTATRRAQSVQEIPYNISAISGDSIDKQGIGNVSELIKGIAGVSGPDLGARAGMNNTIVMRGINTSDAGQSTVNGNMSAAPVSTYLNETPMFTNLKLLDIERVEVLRGPQGTLYGSGAMGGTLRFITNKPSLDEKTVDIRGGFSDSAEGSDLSTEAQIVANIPVSDNFAIRVAAAHTSQAGVIDATNLVTTDASGAPVLADPLNVDSGIVTHSEDDVDEGDILTAKVSALWAVNDSTEVLFNYQHQDEDWDHGTTAYIGTDESLGRGADHWEDSARQLDSVERTVDVASLEISKDFGFASFTSATSWAEDDSEPFRDTSDFYINLDVNFNYYGGFPRILVQDQTEEEKASFTQEFRLVSSGDSDIDWVVGAYYSKEELDSSNLNQMHGLGAWFGDPGITATQDTVFTLATDTEFEDKAMFGEVTWHITDVWQVTLGARYFQQTIERDLEQTLPLCGAFCSDDGLDPQGITRSSNEEDFSDQIFKFNTSYDLAEDTMAYLTVSEGFRRGGANSLPIGTSAFADPRYSLDYEPDKLLNWELGLKGSLDDGRVNYTLATYLIEWDDVQIEAFTGGGFKAVQNADEAESKGVELEVQASLTDNLSMTFGYSHINAEITEDAVAGGAMVFDGDRLPFVSKNQANVALDYLMGLDGGFDLTLHLDGNYRSNFTTQVNEVQDLNNFTKLDGYSLWNTSATLAKDNWSVQLFVKNLGNEEGINAAFVLAANGAGAAAEFGRRGWVNRPRTIGFNFTYSF